MEHVPEETGLRATSPTVCRKPQLPNRRADGDLPSEIEIWELAPGLIHIVKESDGCVVAPRERFERLAVGAVVEPDARAALLEGVLDASDPLAVAHGDPEEPRYAAAYQEYVQTIRDRMRLVYYGQDPALIYEHEISTSVGATLSRGAELYPYVGEEFFRTGELRDWRVFDDRSVAFGVAAISLSWGLTDLANFTSYIWHYGGGLVPTPIPTPQGHLGPTITLPLSGGFPGRDLPGRGAPALPPSRIDLPPP